MIVRNFKNMQIKFSPNNHQYYVYKDGDTIRPFSVSTILKGDDGFGGGARAGRKNYQDTLHEILKVGQGTEFANKDELLEKLILIKKESEDKWKYQAHIGTEVHRFIEDVSKGVVQYSEEKNIQKLQYSLYEYHLKNVVKTNYTERLVYSDNLGANYSGMFDAEIDHKEHGRCLVDFKTYTKKSVTTTWRIQLVAYMNAHIHELNVEPFNRLIIAIDKDNNEVKEFLYTIDSYEKDLEIWKQYLRIHQFLKNKN